MIKSLPRELFLYAGAAALLAMASCQPVAAQDTNCGTTERVEQFLGNFHEVPVLTFVNTSDLVYSIFMNIDTGTWTVVSVDIEEDISCIEDYGSEIVLGSFHELIEEPTY